MAAVEVVESQTTISDFSYFLPVFFFVFCLVYMSAYHITFRKWPSNHRPVASSCMISLAHGTPSVILAFCAILLQPDPGFASPNTNLQNIVLDFSIAYFTVDLLHYIVFFPGDYLFIGHHVATLFVFITCRHLTLHGAFALLVLLILAELTSFCQNVWTLAGIQRSESPVAAEIYNLLSPSFYAAYTLARVIAGPLFFFKMSSFYLLGAASHVISWWISFSWVIVVGAAISVSILWVFNNWLELYRERTHQDLENKKKVM